MSLMQRTLLQFNAPTLAHQFYLTAVEKKYPRALENNFYSGFYSAVLKHILGKHIFSFSFFF